MSEKTKSFLEAFKVEATRESKRSKVLGTEVQTIKIIDIFIANTKAGKSVQLIVDGEIPYVDEDGNIGTSNRIGINGMLNDVASAMGVQVSDNMPVETGDIVAAYGAGLDLDVKVTVTLTESHDGEKSFGVQPKFTGKEVSKFATRIGNARTTRLEEANKYSSLFKAGNTAQDMF